jgi:4-azaleucine resistance transporter AzlC
MNKYIFKQAFKISTPILFGYLAIGIPFGINIVAAGYPWWMSVLMSVFMYAGAGQYIAVGLFAAGVPLPQILITELFVNIRHIVYGLSLITKFKQVGKWKPYLVFSLTDETYALLTSTEVPPRADPGFFYGMIALLDQCYWILG